MTVKNILTRLFVVSENGFLATDHSIACGKAENYLVTVQIFM